MTNIPLTGQFKVTCEYGRKGTTWAAGYHTGIDLVGQDTIYATCDGQVVRTGFDKSYGNFIVVKSSEDGNFHWFCHLARILVERGIRVTRVSKIGVMGSTGKSTGKHLHFEIRNESNKYGDNSNPAEYMGIPNKVGTYNSKDYQIDTSKYLANTSYKGASIVEALNQIGIDSSYNNRKRLAKINGISNYKGTAAQNTQMLNLLKQGKLKENN